MTLRVLIVEDDEDAASVLASLLAMRDFDPVIARSGARALALAAESPVDAVLLDLGLPDMSGYDVCRGLRSLATSRDSVIIALSGWTRPKDRRAAEAAGCDHYLLKPADFALIEKLIKQGRP